jgi:hypothetical protein
MDFTNIPNDFKKEIIDEYILPNYKNSVKHVIQRKEKWAFVASLCFTISTLLVGTSSLLSFANGFFKSEYLNFFAGSVGLFSIMVGQFGAYAQKQDSAKTSELNVILKNIGIPLTIEDLSKYDGNNNTNELTNELTNETTTELTNNTNSINITNTKSKIISFEDNIV